MRKTAVLTILCCLFFPVTLPARAQSPIHEILLSRGVLLLNEGDCEEALAAFEEALKTGPGDRRALYYGAVCRNRTGRYSGSASALEEIVSSTPDYKDAQRELGVAYFGLGLYGKATEMLEGAGAKSPGDAMAAYYLGRSLLADDRYERAMAEFERARGMDPYYEDVCRYYTGVALLGRGDADAAVERFKEAIEAPEALDEVISASRESIRTLRKEKARRFWRAWVRTRYEYDSNVALLPHDEDLVAGSGKGDWRFTVEPSVELAPPLLPNWDTRSLFSFIQTVHNHLGAYNLQGYRLLNTATLKSRYIQPFFGYGFEYYFLDNNRQDYLRSHTFLTGFTVPEGRYGLSRFSYAYRIDDFFLPFEYRVNDRTAANNSVGASQYFFLPRWGDSFLQLGFYWDNNDAKGRNFSYNGYRLFAECFLPLTWEVNLDLLTELYIRDFSESLQGRDDTRQTYIATLSRPLNEYMEVGLQYTYVNNDSNVALFQYGRNIFSLMMELRF